MACRPDLITAGRGGATGTNLARGSVSVMVMETMVMMVTMVMVMPVVMAAHPGMGVQHARLQLHRPEHGSMGGTAVAFGHRGRHREHGNRKQRGGNGLQHCRVLLGSRAGGRMAGPVDHAGEASGPALNPV